MLRAASEARPSVVADAPSAPDPLADASFARKSLRPSADSGTDASARFTVFISAAALAGIAVWLLVNLVSSVVGGAALGARIAGLAALFFMPIVGVVVAGYNIPRRQGLLPQKADARRRIHVLCPRESLERFGTFRDEDFKPEYARVLLVYPRGRVEVTILLACILTPLGADWAGLRPLGVEIPGFFMVQLGFLAAMLIVASIRQTYLRIAPGRLDLMRFTAWRSRADSCETFDLRDNPLVIDPRLRRITVEQDGRPHTISFLGVWSPRRVAHFLLRAAVSTAPTPTLSRSHLSE